MTLIKSKLSDIHAETGVKISDSIDEIINFSDLLILAVKPDIVV